MPSVTAGLKWPPEMGPTANAIARTERPTANATATRPADGAENNAAPHTAVTSVNVPMNSAPSSRGDMVSPLDPKPDRPPGANHMLHQVWPRGNCASDVAALRYQVALDRKKGP